MHPHNGYLVSGTAVAGPPYTTYWEAMGTVLKPGRSGSVVDVGRIHDPGCTFELQELAAIWGLELARVVLDECLGL